MLNGVDPVSGEKLSDENIGYQMITFLIAGHETTSGLLSFATYLLLKNPAVLQQARALVDEVLGEEMPRVEHLAQLRYIEQILMESLRIWPTASVFSVRPVADTVLAGKYPLTTPGHGHDPRADAPSRHHGVGRRCLGLPAGTLRAGECQRVAAQCLETVRQRLARLHRGVPSPCRRPSSSWP